MKTSVSISQWFTMADQCALNPNRTLKDTSEILFYDDPDNLHLLLPPSSPPKALSYGLRAKWTDHLSKSIIQEQLGSDIEVDEGFVYQWVGITGLLLHILPVIRLFLLLTHLMPFLLKTFLMLKMAIILTQTCLDLTHHSVNITVLNIVIYFYRVSYCSI